MHTAAIQFVLADVYASYWLKGALRSAVERDPVDAVNDAEHLVDLLRERLNRIQGKG